MNSSELKGYLTGLIFGDGYIDHGVTNRAFRIRSINKDFIEKIYNDLSSCTNFKMSIIFHKGGFANGCNHKDHWELYIKAHPYFAKKYHHFYDDFGKRVVTKDSLSWLNDKGLANWYCGDGYICLVGKSKGEIKDRRLEICTDRYSKETVEKMSVMLKNKFNLYTSLIKRKNSYRIRIKKDSYETFFNLVYPYMPESLKYRLWFGYDFQPKWMSDEMRKLQENFRSAIALTGNAEG